MAYGGYTLGEIAWLMSLRFVGEHSDDIDVGTFRDSLAQVTPDGEHASSSSADLDPIPAYARYAEVDRARRRVVRDDVARAAQETLALELRLQGLREGEIAEILSVSTPTAHRRWHALLDAIAAELGGTVEFEEAMSVVPACLRCGANARARIPARTWRSASGRRMQVDERQSSLCEACLEDARLKRLAKDVRRADLRAEPDLSDDETSPDDAPDPEPAWHSLSVAA